MNEVRYIDTSVQQGDKVYKNDWRDVYKQEPIMNNEKIRVFHGCSLKDAVQFATEGLSGKQWQPRKFSYEMGMNPVGLFVTTSFNTAKQFSNSSNGSKEKNALVIIEFTANSNDLDSPIWNGQDSFFGQYSNPQSFKDKNERDIQKQKYNNDAANDEYEYIRKSSNKALAKNIFKNVEHQALFIGDLSPNMIKRFWVKPLKKQDYYWCDTETHYIPMKRHEFLKEYGKLEFYEYGSNNKYCQIRKQKLYSPTDDFDGIDGMAKRIVDRESNTPYQMKRKTEGIYDYDKELKDEIESINDVLKWKEYSTLEYYLFPKQLIQLLGKEEYMKVFDKYGIGIKNESKNINMKKVNRITENDLHKIVRNSVKRVIRENQENEIGFQGRGVQQKYPLNDYIEPVKDLLNQAYSRTRMIVAKNNHSLMALKQQLESCIALCDDVCKNTDYMDKRY